MNVFFAVVLGIFCAIGAILSVPLANRFMERAQTDLLRTWRWRLAGILTLLLGVALVFAAFVLIPTILSF